MAFTEGSTGYDVRDWRYSSVKIAQKRSLDELLAVLAVTSVSVLRTGNFAIALDALPFIFKADVNADVLLSPDASRKGSARPGTLMYETWWPPAANRRPLYKLPSPWQDRTRNENSITKLGQVFTGRAALTVQSAVRLVEVLNLGVGGP
jgi:hypothetical protein